MTTPPVSKTTNFAATLRLCRELGLPELPGKRLAGNVRYNNLKALSLLLTGLATPPPAGFTPEAGPAGIGDWRRAAREQGDEKLGDRAVAAFLHREVRRQANREAVARLAVDLLLRGSPRKDNPREIEDDWLDIFAETAAAKSAPDIQRLLARLLAAEIRKPGSFSPSAIQTVGLLTRKTVAQFRRFSALSLRNAGISFVITSPWPDFRSKGEPDLGIKYQELLDLQSAGLLPASLSSNLDLKAHINRTTFALPDRSVVIAQERLEALPKLPQLDVILLSPVGHELRAIMEPDAHPEYQERLAEWFKSHGLMLGTVS